MKRVVKPEWLDELAPHDPRAERSRRDIQRLNLISAHHRIMAAALDTALKRHVSRRIVELGAGNGRFLLSVARRLTNQPKSFDAILVDRVDGVDAEVLVALRQLGWKPAVEIADAMEWMRQRPAKPAEEIILTNQFLHQFQPDVLSEMFRLMANFASVLIAVEPRRNFFSLLCSRLVGVVGCGPVTRYDAPISVRAGFNGRELSFLWPDKKNWELAESRAGLFSHLFVAQRKI